MDELAEVGARFTHHTSIAPTGTISLSLGNNASNGIEPSFSHSYSRNVIREGRKTKEKIARVSGADLDLYEQSLTLEIRGSDAARGRAKKYVECVMAQRVGPVTIDDATDDDDLTCIQVPSEAVGFVTGSQGNFLRQVEEEWGTLMFFADFRGRNKGDQVPASSASTSQPPRPPPPLLHTLPRRLCAAVAG